MGEREILRGGGRKGSALARGILEALGRILEALRGADRVIAGNGLGQPEVRVAELELAAMANLGIRASGQFVEYIDAGRIRAGGIGTDRVVIPRGRILWMTNEVFAQQVHRLGRPTGVDEPLGLLG